MSFQKWMRLWCTAWAWLGYAAADDVRPGRTVHAINEWRV